MAKVPYIPLYIGDWEQDTNCLSLQAEAAWLKIIIKMHKDDKSGIYKASTKALQNLFKSSAAVVSEIVAELIENQIGIIEVSPDGLTYVFKNRRMMREKKISEKRRKAVQSRYNSSTKTLQNAEYDIDNENESEFVGEKGGAGEGEPPAQPASDPEAFVVPRMLTAWKAKFPKYIVDESKDYPALRAIAFVLCDQLAIAKAFDQKATQDAIISLWKQIVAHMQANSHYATYSVERAERHFQSIWQSFNKPAEPEKSELDYLYSRFLEDGKLDHRVITEAHLSELEQAGQLHVTDDILQECQKKRWEWLQSPRNQEETAALEAWKKQDTADTVWQTEQARIVFNARKTALLRYFRACKAQSMKTLHLTKKAG